jgi:hypothetical protein
MPRNRERVRLESGLSIDLNNLRREGFVVPGRCTVPRNIVWKDVPSGELIASGSCYSDAQWPEEGGSLNITLGGLRQKLRLRAVPRHFGGHQWYFVCPFTSRLCSVLWLLPRADKFGSRQTWGRRVAYSSQFATAHDRAIYSARHIHYQLGAKGRIAMDDHLPPKPKGMHWRTYDKLAARCERYENISRNCFFDKAVWLSDRLLRMR